MLPSPSTSIPRQLLLAVLAVAALLAVTTVADNDDGDARAGEASGTAVVGCGAFLEAAESCSKEAAQGHTQRAREMATQLVGVVPGCAKAWACYGAVAYQLQNLQEAKTGFEQVRSCNVVCCVVLCCVRLLTHTHTRWHLVLRRLH